MSNLTILNTAIRQYENLFSLNDLHQLSGNGKSHQPSNFTRLDTTQDLVAEIQKDSPAIIPIKALRGTQGGTFACEEIALAYAMWISPKFHLVVLRAFIAMHKGEVKQQQLALPEPEKKYTFEFTEDTCLRLVSMWFALYNNLELLGQLHQPLSNIGSHFGSTAYTHYTEYQTTLGVMKSVLEPMTKDFNPDPYQEAHYYKALKTLRDYQLKGLARIVKHPTPPTRKYEL
ncbi:P22AR C-terminal domain-containing protein [Mannheimia sp. AT1]|uniref:P22AR C-terminal domain-containing protein n=1 Tax=Mannheimia cairinae TaxID=3025936 RepID=A0ABT5ML91_9PAST|nr:P22AR C-terminal domain-containing protein [Mannheimia cairinae]MDD0822960.1 P22AR C-terminal domain-containing protein [Mannheimia cairinae]MDD0826012.1 P22AR C-terminal domain-containing protein [Mannheimia cairinae]